ncbi:AAA family ATPase [Leucothrix arctica]|uniref:AAA family ATPase n=1 Tax=Leucothrix arctica TaxID=1481894 RepID=A0A317C5L0_9GAMM|nr:AAA family ATPase [Leucothrix arctica]
MIPRNISKAIYRYAKSFPVVEITGPRQSGKTTLVRSLFADKPYVTLEDPSERLFAEDDPKGFLARFSEGAIFDEAQRWPDLFSYLQGMVDEDRQVGRFILTGSQQFSLLAGVSQSLAGRAGVTRLLPLASSEIPNLSASSLNSILITGGYPALHAQTINAQDWFASYIATYVERDVRQLINVQDLTTFQRFLRFCAGRSGSLLNLNALAGEAGVTNKVAQAWMSVLQSSDLVYLLPPYHKNFGKRLVKTPKLYFVDTGLACWLLGIRSEEVLALHPLRGALFETWVVAEALKARYNAGEPADLYFWRDNNGVEADLLYEKDGMLQTIEVKSGATVTRDYIKAGQKAAKFAGDEALTPWLVHGGDDNYERNGVDVVGWRNFAERIFK